MGQPVQNQLSLAWLREWPEQGLFWALVFALLYLLTFYLVSLTPKWLEVTENRVHLIYLPAFIRVAAVMISGVAGVLGVFLGSLLTGLLLLDDGLVMASLNAASSALAPALAWTILIVAFQRLPSMSLPNLMLMGLFTGLLSPILHAVYWTESSVVQTSLMTTSCMMLGDLGGMLVGFLLLKFGLRWSRRFVGPARF